MFGNKKQEKEAQEFNFLIRQNLKDIEDIKHKLTIAEAKIEAIKDTKTLSEGDKETLSDLTVKMAKLWGLLLETTPNGKVKASKFGRKLYGGKGGFHE